MSDAKTFLTPDDLTFLQRPLHGFFTAAGGPVPPQPRPVWFEASDASTVQLFTGPESLKVRHVRKDPRASLVVAAPAGEREGWVSVAGPATVEEDGAAGLCRRLGVKYWDLDDPARAADLEGMLAETWVRIVVHVESVRRYWM
jgi:hypothetical protein